MRGPQEFTLGRQAAEKLARQTRYVERLPRNRQPHRRRHITTKGAGIKLGVLQTALDYNGSASVKFYNGEPNHEEPDGNDSKTCYAWMLQSGDSIGASTEVVCASINGHWYVIAAGCTAGS